MFSVFRVRVKIVRDRVRVFRLFRVRAFRVRVRVFTVRVSVFRVRVRLRC